MSPSFIVSVFLYFVQHLIDKLLLFFIVFQLVAYHLFSDVDRELANFISELELCFLS